MRGAPELIGPAPWPERPCHVLYRVFTSSTRCSLTRLAAILNLKDNKAPRRMLEGRTMQRTHVGDGQEAIDRESQRVHDWRVTRLIGLGIPWPVAEVDADRVDWHQIARLVLRGCPPMLALRIAVLPLSVPTSLPEERKENSGQPSRFTACWCSSSLVCHPRRWRLPRVRREGSVLLRRRRGGARCRGG